MKNKIYKIVTVAITATVMQSCFVAKEYERPKDIKTENLYRTEVVAKDSTSLADVSWDKVFTDPILQSYIKKGLQNNLDIRIAMQNIVAAEASMKQGKAGYFPTLSAGADWTHQQLSKNSQFGALLQDRSTDQFQLTGTLGWEADIWGKIRSNKRATNAVYLQTTAANQAVKTQLIADIAATYYQLISFDAQIKIAEETLINRTQSIETIIALKDAGNVTEVGVKQTEAQKYATEIIIADLKINATLLENKMAILLGDASTKIERNSFESQVLNPAITIGVPATLLRNRPDVIAAEYNLISNFEQTNVARSNFYPTLKITATGGLQSIDLKEWFSANSFFANIVTGLAQPIFNQRQIKTKFEIAKANQEKAYLQFEQSLLNAGKEVSDAMARYNTQAHKITVRQKQVDALKIATDYSDELLKYGLVNYLEVLTAKDDALNAELTLVTDKYEQYNSVIQLYRALGGGWK
jgi:multidrug efflux system outer membrane protein